MIQTKLYVSGDVETSANLAMLGAAMQGRILRKAVRAGSRVVINRARALVPKDSGTLAKSLDVKVKTYANKVDVGGKLRNVSTGRTVGIIGPKVGYEAVVSRSGQLNKDKTYKLATGASGKVIVRQPTKYAHLVEKGTRPHSVKRAVDVDRVRSLLDVETVWKSGRKRYAYKDGQREQVTEVVRRRHAANYRRDLARYGKGAVHPGAKPKPFLVPGIESSKSMVNSVMGVEISRGILEEARKCSTRTSKRGS